MISHTYLVQYSFTCRHEEAENVEPEEDDWSDEGACTFSFDPDEERQKVAALAAARAYANYLDSLEEEDDTHPALHRVVYRLTSDEAVA